MTTLGKSSTVSVVFFLSLRLQINLKVPNNSPFFLPRRSEPHNVAAKFAPDSHLVDYTNFDCVDFFFPLALAMYPVYLLLDWSLCEEVRFGVNDSFYLSCETFYIGERIEKLLQLQLCFLSPPPINLIIVKHALDISQKK